MALFDAGDVQANGFQVVEDEREGQTFSETGASYMGFAVSALLATALPTTASPLLRFSCKHDIFIFRPPGSLLYFEM